MKIHTMDFVEVEIESTSKVNGPSQGSGGLSFGMSSVYYKVSGKEWKKSEERSLRKTIDLIEHSKAFEL